MKTFFSKGCVVERERAYQLTFGKIPTAFFESLGVKAVRASEKTVPEGIFGAPKEAVVGFLQGLFSSDGTVQIAKKQRNSIRLASSSSSLLKGVQVLLLNFGILSSIYLRRKTGEKLMPNSNSDLQIYVTKPQYELIISRKSKEKFATEIGFILSSKQKKLQSVLCDMRRGSYKDTFTDVIVSIQPAGNEDVYDITEPQTHSLIANGFVTHNCGEQFLLPFENCCMASINLAEHVSNGRKGIFAYNIDWEKLKETTEWTVRWLDDVIDTNKYVSAVPQLEEAAKRNRRIGVSIMGLADLLYKIGVRYGSREGIDCAGQIMEFIRFHTLRASMQLAQERGAFPGIKGSRYDFSASNAALLKAKQSDVWEPTKPLHPYKSTYKMPKLDWKTLTSDIKKHGVRNSCQNTIQPTGAIATVTGLEGYGCEPVFALSYVMRTHEGAEEIGQDFRELYYESALFKEALERSGITGKKLAAIFEKVREKGTCQGITEVPKAIRDVFVVSGDVCVDEHVEMQAALQRFVDNAISKTINFPAGATVKEVFDAYLKGWRMGLKGMTVYVTGSRNKVVLETSETTKKREEEEKAAAEAAKVANSKKGAIPSQPKPSLNMDRPKVDAAARSQSDEFVGTPLVKMKPGDSVCPECGAELVIQEGCFTCPNCAYSKCSI